MKTGLDPGILRHRLYVEAPYEVPDGAGGVTRAFETVGLVWGLIEPLGGTELLAEERLVQRLTHRIILRRFAGLTAAHRLRKGARLFDIRAIREDVPARSYLTLLAEEVAP
ncbi:head-tail adaptor protein [Phreatobacter oligotrophus]|jgi:head-tail adaptor|uniref:head-tail adaptor protein n=1 Tax=Phreatobacter oligotrophus TaxID=1122261 RepID=UPI0023548F35|nr:head-tail adaptor protein [Phreatobacter oligotrophus]MBX9989052.1 head-tail adaptor protein [Phreatobacter oligotrophus]